MNHIDRMKAFAPRSNASVGVMGSANPSDIALLLAAPVACSRRETYSERSADKQRSFEAERLARSRALAVLCMSVTLPSRVTLRGARAKAPARALGK